jgi:hypothetical protein
MFRNLSPVVGPVAEINNYLLPMWMIAFGVFLIRYREKRRKISPVPVIAPVNPP